MDETSRRVHIPFRPKIPFRERPRQYQQSYLATKLLAQFQFRMGNLVRILPDIGNKESVDE